MNRLGIFCFFDTDGIVDDYIVYLLNDLSNNLERLVIVVNGSLQEAGRCKLERFSKEVLIRENKGFDAAAWKYGLEYIGFDKLENYDELLLLNDTFYGPLYPFETVFTNMTTQQIDFWGLTINGTARWLEQDIAEHIQSDFIVFRNNILRDHRFKLYWDSMRLASSFIESLLYNETVLTKYFADLGYRYTCYCTTPEITLKTGEAINNCAYNQMTMIAEYKLPVVRRKNLMMDKQELLYYNRADEPCKVLEYIKENYNYDLCFIYSYMLRKCNILDIKTWLNLDYVLPRASSLYPEYQNSKKVAVVAHLFYDDLIEQSIVYLKNAIGLADVYITTDSQKKREAIVEALGADSQHVSVILVHGRGRDVAALLVGCRDIVKNYDYFCFIHDKKSGRMKPFTVGKAFAELLWDNTLKSSCYIKNIIGLLDREPQLGLLVPPPPKHGGYMGLIYDNYWSGTYKDVQILASKLKLSVPISENNMSLSFGTAFWCRTDALITLFELGWSYNDFPEEPLPDPCISHAIERIFPYVAQSRGYLTGVVMNDAEAATEIENINAILKNNDKNEIYSDVFKERHRQRLRKIKYKQFVIILVSIVSLMVAYITNSIYMALIVAVIITFMQILYLKLE